MIITSLRIPVQALVYKRGKNMAAAKKKMIERARVQSQLEKIQNSISMIDIHRCVCVCVLVFENISAIKLSMHS